MKPFAWCLPSAGWALKSDLAASKRQKVRTDRRPAQDDENTCIPLCAQTPLTHIGLQEQGSNVFPVHGNFLEDLQVSPFKTVAFFLQMGRKKPWVGSVSSKIVGKHLSVGLV